MEKNKITVVTVTYNAAEWLEKTIQSVLSQDYPNIEYIIIDGGSSDGTLEVIRNYESHLDYWISEPDKGIYDAMNKGILVASGDWINFMNAGDTFASCATLSDIICELTPEIGLFCGAIQRVNENGDLLEIRLPNKLQSVWHLIPAWHQAMLIKTSLMKQYLYDTGYKIAGDHDFILKCFSRGEQFKFTNKILCHMLSGGLNEQESTRTRIESLFALSRYVPDEKLIYGSVWYQGLKANEPNDNRLYVSLLFNKLFDQIMKLVKEYEKIALYGYGKVGMMIAALCHEKLVVIADKEDKRNELFPSCFPDELSRYEFDVLIITVLGREEYIVDDLVAYSGISPKKIAVLNFDD